MVFPVKKILPNALLAVFEEVTDYLKAHGIEEHRINAEVLLCHVMKCSKANLYASPDSHLTAHQIDTVMALAERRILRQPLQYITGSQEFWSLDFKVTKDVLIPRPETEVLIEEAVKTGYASRINYPIILDICTGSGCIAVTLAKEMPNALVYAIDISAEALHVARENAERHNVANRIEFICSNLFDALAGQSLPQNSKPETQDYLFDLIVSNPPYIKTGDIEKLLPEIRDFEPMQAIDGGGDGIEIIKRIIENAHIYLNNNGWLMIEIGAGQGREVERLLEMNGNYREIAIIKDYSGIERVVRSQKWTK